MSSSPFEDISHKAHEQWYDIQFPDNSSRIEAINSWKKGIQNQNIAFWLQNRMWNLIDPFINKGEKWLTVGDGYGLDAHYLLGKEAKVCSSDISDTFLSLAKENGFIEEFSIENAEKLSFKDQSFDYVLCKESYHHFPRPYLAVYEMIRVAEKGIMLIEPNDPLSQMPLLLAMVNLLDRIHSTWVEKIWKNRFSFETVGNYVFKLSIRECEKIAMGLNLPAMAYKGINNSYYQTDSGTELASPDSKALKKIKFKIRRANFLSASSILPYQLLAVVLFKVKPDPDKIQELTTAGYYYREFPKNPYLKKD
jgi:ubiquinone/menaquinone biosynthesis C-methylase UbiE